MIAVSGTVTSVKGGQVMVAIQDEGRQRQIWLKTRDCCRVRLVRGKATFGSARKAGIKTGRPVFVAVDSRGEIHDNWGPDPRKPGSRGRQLTGQSSRRYRQALRRLTVA